MLRRDFLKYASLSGLTPLLAKPTGVKAASSPKRALRIAHITDVHVRQNPEDEFSAARGLEQCLHHIQDQDDPPDIIFNGGDSIDDALGASRSAVRRQWALWHRILREENSLPVVHGIGNHDVWGAGPASDPRYGKRWAVEAMNLERRYYSFDRAGWHFIVLDSTRKMEGDWYTAKLDEEQFQWLKQDLDATPSETPILVLSHIPILCAAAFFDGDNEQSGDWVIPGAWVHIDARRIVELFYEHPNVQLCVSGHIHLLDHVVYNGVSYFCNGAVSGNWWNGRYHQTPPGYAMINLYADGAYEREYVAYGPVE